MPKKNCRSTLPAGWKEGTPSEMLGNPFLKEHHCQCLYCTTPEIKSFIDDNLAALAEDGYPRPKKFHIIRPVAEKFRVHETTVDGWFRCIPLWNSWPNP